MSKVPILVLLALCAAASGLRATPQTTPAPGFIARPVGRHPRLIVTPARRAVWARMKADFEANPAAPPTLGGVWYKLIETNAECACKYSDNGLWGTLMYQMTADKRYVDLAFAKITGGFLNKDASQFKGNYSRENFIQYVLMYDWLYTGLTPAQREQFLAKLNVMATGVLTNPYAPAFPLRASDSDQMLGDYFGLASLYVATKDYNPLIVDLWARPYIGGLSATGADATTFRNVINKYVTDFAAGGEWIESEDYNLGTVKLLTLGAEMVKTGASRDYFPEITALVPQLALRWIHRVTPDLKQAYQWGDEEHPRDFAGRLFYRVEVAMVLAGLTQQDPAVGPYIQDLVQSLVEKYGATGYKSAEPWARGFLVYNPYAARQSRSALPVSNYAAGMGMLQYRTGWNEADSLFSAHFPQPIGVDHTPSYFGEFQLYRKGEWAITHPLSYGGPGDDGRGTNGMLIGGLPWMYWVPQEFKQPLATETSNEFAYITGTLGGQVARNGAYNAPPTFLHEWTRSLVYLPGFEAIVIYDRVNALDPRTMDLSGYDAKVQAQMRSMPALKQWFIHSPVVPRLAAGSIEWSLPSRAEVRVDVLLPAGYSATLEDEKALWPKGSVSMVEDEKKWHVRVSPPADRRWDTFLNVAQVFDGTAAPTKLLRSADGQVEGALLVSPGSDSAAVLFNATPGPTLPDGKNGYRPETQKLLATARLRRTGYSVVLTTASSVTKVLLLDLDPTLSWAVSIDGRTAVPLGGSTSVKQLTVPAPGAHKLDVLAR